MARYEAYVEFENKIFEIEYFEYFDYRLTRENKIAVTTKNGKRIVAADDPKWSERGRLLKTRIAYYKGIAEYDLYF